MIYKKSFRYKILLKCLKDELNQKLEIQEQSMIRRKKEIQEHGNDLDSMLNDDYNRDQNILDNDSRKTFISENCKHLFISYLDSNKIQYKQQQDGDYSLKKDDSKKLYDLLTPLEIYGQQCHNQNSTKESFKGAFKYLL